jgi:hypothetical protein
MPSQVLHIGIDKLKVCKFAQVRVKSAYLLPNIAIGRDGLDLKLRVLGNHAQQLATNVSAGASDGYRVNHLRLLLVNVLLVLGYLR